VVGGVQFGEDHVAGKLMRPLSTKSTLTAVLAIALAASAALAQAPPSAGAGDASARAARETPGPVRTGKERLGNKWNDEQRVDNCKVPPDKRGAKPRPDACAEAVTH